VSESRERERTRRAKRGVDYKPKATEKVRGRAGGTKGVGVRAGAVECAATAATAVHCEGGLQEEGGLYRALLYK